MKEGIFYKVEGDTHQKNKNKIYNNLLSQIQKNMKTNSISLGDEVRFHTSPTIIKAKSSRREPRERRLKATTNKNGLLEMDVSGLTTVPGEVFVMLRTEVLKLNNNALHILEPPISR